MDQSEKGGKGREGKVAGWNEEVGRGKRLGPSLGHVVGDNLRVCHFDRPYPWTLDHGSLFLDLILVTA